ncbi:hypothetical protein BZA05DRAFT_445604 [Tricharina praecox]|uniref:uncharacterized protein n=1 Tax=Tricharina praecox TaxID=43433 RepID=UPI0022202D72|nr:uncharacterized protein BZA05DRAFT_445604 [Tricharina praecox]KAI5850774.1 hypothetical protein BZA05DRAFT_445604 [Tricharina praecox]
MTKKSDKGKGRKVSDEISALGFLTELGPANAGSHIYPSLIRSGVTDVTPVVPRGAHNEGPSRYDSIMRELGPPSANSHVYPPSPIADQTASASWSKGYSCHHIRRRDANRICEGCSDASSTASSSASHPTRSQMRRFGVTTKSQGWIPDTRRAIHLTQPCTFKKDTRARIVRHSLTLQGNHADVTHTKMRTTHLFLVRSNNQEYPWDSRGDRMVIPTKGESNTIRRKKNFDMARRRNGHILIRQETPMEEESNSIHHKKNLDGVGRRNGNILIRQETLMEGGSNTIRHKKSLDGAGRRSGLILIRQETTIIRPSTMKEIIMAGPLILVHPKRTCVMGCEIVELCVVPTIPLQSPVVALRCRIRVVLYKQEALQSDRRKNIYVLTEYHSLFIIIIQETVDTQTSIPKAVILRISYLVHLKKTDVAMRCPIRHIFLPPMASFILRPGTKTATYKVGLQDLVRHMKTCMIVELCIALTFPHQSTGIALRLDIREALYQQGALQSGHRKKIYVLTAFHSLFITIIQETVDTHTSIQIVFILRIYNLIHPQKTDVEMQYPVRNIILPPMESLILRSGSKAATSKMGLQDSAPHMKTCRIVEYSVLLSSHLLMASIVLRAANRVIVSKETPFEISRHRNIGALTEHHRICINRLKTSTIRSSVTMMVFMAGIFDLALPRCNLVLMGYRNRLFLIRMNIISWSEKVVLRLALIVSRCLFQIIECC